MAVGRARRNLMRGLSILIIPACRFAQRTKLHLLAFSVQIGKILIPFSDLYRSEMPSSSLLQVDNSHGYNQLVQPARSPTLRTSGERAPTHTPAASSRRARRIAVSAWARPARRSFTASHSCLGLQICTTEPPLQRPIRTICVLFPQSCCQQN